MRPVLILFAKAPVEGRVKTRLIPYLTPQQAAALHAVLVEDMLQRLKALKPATSLELHTDEPTEAWPEATTRCLQIEGDLGARMLHAIVSALDKGRTQVMVLGSDAAGLPLAHIEELLACPADVTLGPSADGGYYAISCRRTAPGMFNGVRWSTRNALADTLAAALACGLTAAVGPPWFDIDTPEDLVRLPESLRLRAGLPVSVPSATDRYPETELS